MEKINTFKSRPHTYTHPNAWLRKGFHGAKFDEAMARCWGTFQGSLTGVGVMIKSSRWVRLPSASPFVFSPHQLNVRKAAQMRHVTNDPIQLENDVLSFLARVSLHMTPATACLRGYEPALIGYAANVVKDMREVDLDAMKEVMAIASGQLGTHEGPYRDFVQERWRVPHHFDVRKTRVEMRRHLMMQMMRTEPEKGTIQSLGV